MVSRIPMIYYPLCKFPFFKVEYFQIKDEFLKNGADPRRHPCGQGSSRSDSPQGKLKWSIFWINISIRIRLPYLDNVQG